MHIISLDVAAVRGSIAVVDRVTEADLTLPTPCAGWDLAALLGHMTAQHHGFAAAARGRGADPAAWHEEPAGADAAKRYAEAAEEALTAFAEAGVLDRPFRMAGFDQAVPGRMAIGFHLVDYVVHGWDVARALGVGYQPEREVLAAALPIARAVPDGPDRLAPGAPFGPARVVPDGVDALTEVLLLLGRDPAA